MVWPCTAVRRLDAVWKIDLMRKINFKKQGGGGGARGKKEVTSVTGTFTVVLLPSATFSAASTSAMLIFRITLGGPPSLVPAKKTSSVSGT
jgi:hypothetical protein